jgi:hypothetical protein
VWYVVCGGSGEMMVVMVVLVLTYNDKRKFISLILCVTTGASRNLLWDTDVMPLVGEIEHQPKDIILQVILQKAVLVFGAKEENHVLKTGSTKSQR